MRPSDAFAIALLLVVAGAIAWLVIFVIRGLWGNRKSMATRIRAKPDPRCVVHNMPAGHTQTGHRY